MNNETKYVAIDINLIKDILVLKQIEHSIHAFEATTFNLIIDNIPENYHINEETGKIDWISPTADVYIAQKIDEENDRYSVDSLITDELELNNVVFAKYDVISFDLTGVTCRAMIIDFNSNDEGLVYLEMLITTDDGLTIFNIPFNEDSHIEHVGRVDQSIIDELVNSIEIEEDEE